MELTIDNDILIFKCPHCNEFIQVELNQINCSIFRHGVFKANMDQINPHSPKLDCDSYVSRDLIFGCGKPFKIVKDCDKYVVVVCEYI
jgi:hypothetical protein